MIQIAEKENAQTIENFNAAIMTVLFRKICLIHEAPEYRAPPGAIERGEKDAG